MAAAVGPADDDFVNCVEPKVKITQHVCDGDTVSVPRYWVEFLTLCLLLDLEFSFPLNQFDLRVQTGLQFIHTRGEGQDGFMPFLRGK